MNRKEHIHIGLPVFNGEAHLVEALESLLSQTHENCEIFVVDNLSTDGTKDIVQAYVKKDSRIKYFRQDQWVSAAVNCSRTFEIAARGVRFFMFASDDDLWAKDYVESMLPPLIKRPEIVLSFSQVDLIDEEGQRVNSIYRRYFPIGLTSFKRIQSTIRCGSLSAIYGLIRTEAVQWNPPLSETCFGADLWFLLRLATMGQFHITKSPLFYKRLGGISETGEDPSTVRCPETTWNIGPNEWRLICGLNIRYHLKLYVFYRLKLSAKALYPQSKRIDWFLTPVFWYCMLLSNARCFGLRTRLKTRWSLNNIQKSE